MEINYKIAEAEDFDRLWQLVEQSLAGEKTKLTRECLRENLFGKIELDADVLASGCEDAAIEMDLNQARLSCPICRAIVVQVGDQLGGYLIYHQYYTPWRGRGVFIEIIYVAPAHRKRGFARNLLKRLEGECKDEDAQYFLYESTRIEPALRETLVKYGATVARDNTSHWSMFRIYL